ncbi:MAG: BMP family ABC transporter substrate-binding protein [Eubacteriales bacterium]|nr:BMP family ABC transporter substrate-binding protein [Eubacteriales bacterium]
MQPNYEREAKATYNEAYKLARKNYAALQAEGKKGTLKALSEVLEQNKIIAYVKQPIKEIPLSSVVGTYTSGRARSFSGNFMPLHVEKSEFASKWISLCAAHINEGIRDAIEVYEYMWQYYVIEGNKRVSVLKYFGAPTIRANITRVIPQYNDEDPNIKLYYASLKYDKKGFFKGVKMSRAENYDTLAEIEQGIELSEEEEQPKHLNGIYLQFITALEQLEIDLPVGDVILQYLQLYGMPRDTVLSEIKSRILDMEPQLKLISLPQIETNILLEKEQDQPAGLMQRLFNIKRTAKVMFAYEEGRTDSNWIGAHEKGRRIMQEALASQVETFILDDLNELNCYDALDQNAKNCDLVIVTSTRLMNAALRFQLENPNLLVLVYSRVRENANLVTYYGRYYEAVFLCGLAAGFASKNRKVAYITPALKNRHTTDINAFALGVRTVSPFADVYVVSKDVLPDRPDTCISGIKHAAALGVDVVMSPLTSDIDLKNVPKDAFSAVFSIDDTGMAESFLASPAWDWGRFYTEIVKSFLNNSLDYLQDIKAQDNSVTGLWWGFGTGVLKLRLGDFLDPAAENLIHYLRSSIALARFNPYHGPVKDSEGDFVISSQADLRPYDILNMEWIADFIRLVR